MWHLHLLVCLVSLIAEVCSADTFIDNNGPQYVNQPDNERTDARLTDIETRVQQPQLLLDKRQTGYTTIQGIPRGIMFYAASFPYFLQIFSFFPLTLFMHC